MNKKIQAVIAVVVAVWLFVMGFEFGKYHEKKSAAKEPTAAAADSENILLPTETEKTPTDDAETTGAPTVPTDASTVPTLPSLTQPSDVTVPTGIDDIETYPLEDVLPTFPLEDALTTYPEDQTAAAPTGSDVDTSGAAGADATAKASVSTSAPTEEPSAP